MTFYAKLSATEGLDHLAARLDPIIAVKFPADLGGHPWTVVLSQLDQDRWQATEGLQHG